MIDMVAIEEQNARQAHVTPASLAWLATVRLSNRLEMIAALLSFHSKVL